MLNPDLYTPVVYWRYKRGRMTIENAKKILIVEDEKPMAKALELLLNHQGYVTCAVFNGQEALDELKRTTYDLMLLDLIMPVMDGLSTFEALHAQSSSIPVIMMANLAKEEDVERANELGARDFIIKSNTPIAEIVERINKYFDSK